MSIINNSFVRFAEAFCEEVKRWTGKEPSNDVQRETYRMYGEIAASLSEEEAAKIGTMIGEEHVNFKPRGIQPLFGEDVSKYCGEPFFWT